jgi:hypothetical protein
MPAIQDSHVSILETEESNVDFIVLDKIRRLWVESCKAEKLFREEEYNLSTAVVTGPDTS